MAAEEHDGPSGESESHNQVPQNSAPRKIPPGNDFVHVAWIVLALIVFGLILTAASGDCSNCDSSNTPLWH
ncbi:GATA-type transcription factor [Kitasatospora griseola]|uniref:hypothetical protein n=1 Tax=Kitasatospora griseola TaxID=2064 RepID=UPI0038150F31